MKYEIFNMDCRDVMDLYLPDNSVDAIVTDPPYGLSFMGKEWDHGVPGVEFWTRALRVLKPGGHLLAFGGTRAYHRLVCAIEDAGFEVRDTIMWVYGSGFPKSHDVSKAIDKAAGVAFDAIPASGVGFMNAEGAGGYNTTKNQLVRSGSSTEAAQQWQGWGTALKPAHEPICVARKPLIGTVAANVLHWGTGALNIDGCRVGTNGEVTGGSGAKKRDTNAFGDFAGNGGNTTPEAERWPANLIHDGSDEVVGAFPDAKGQQGKSSAARFFYCAKASKKDRNEGCEALPLHQPTHGKGHEGGGLSVSSSVIPNNNNHPTVKPTDLMAYLCRLVTPAGGVVFDPFMGSGSTGKAALREGFRFIGCEKETEYSVIAEARLKAAV